MENLTQSESLDNLIDALAIEPFQLEDEYKELNATQWAWVIESLTKEQRLILWPHLDSSMLSSILSELHEDVRQQIVALLPKKDIEATVCAGTSVEALDILEVLPQKTASNIIKKLSSETQSEVEASLSYEEDEVGRYANKHVYTIADDALVSTVITAIKNSDTNLESNALFVVSSDLKFLGEVSLNDLLNAPKSSNVSAIVERSDMVLNDKESLIEASKAVQSTQKSLVPVIKENGQFVGVFSIHDALYIFQEFYEAQMAHMGKVNDEDLFSPVLTSTRRRAVWLGINLLTAFLASFVIGMFDKVLIEIVALAVLMPIVASMGGITGSQSLTLTIRGLATNQISQGNLSALHKKEFYVALLNSLCWATVVAVICYFWFENSVLAVIIAIAIIINMIVAAFSGVFIPVILEKMGVDPAIAGSVILTTVTDVVGFFVFLGGASIIFLW
ncbi:magnesium transporter [Thalassotalea marina]|uniref:Magnesium transporter n=1 Tax=Thalassotalea marina TaxID=1673741 RepID=A0A919EL98_9GAMM|nr:magnesium transporter [Thalassotalea marina]GHF98418.1 magnesium transporter [Thalassotalea marina]